MRPSPQTISLPDASLPRQQFHSYLPGARACAYVCADRRVGKTVWRGASVGADVTWQNVRLKEPTKNPSAGFGALMPYGHSPVTSSSPARDQPTHTHTHRHIHKTHARNTHAVSHMVTHTQTYGHPHERTHAWTPHASRERVTQMSPTCFGLDARVPRWHVVATDVGGAIAVTGWRLHLQRWHHPQCQLRELAKRHPRSCVRASCVRHACVVRAAACVRVRVIVRTHVGSLGFRRWVAWRERQPRTQTHTATRARTYMLAHTNTHTC